MLSLSLFLYRLCSKARTLTKVVFYGGATCSFTWASQYGGMSFQFLATSTRLASWATNTIRRSEQPGPHRTTHRLLIARTAEVRRLSVILGNGNEFGNCFQFQYFIGEEISVSFMIIICNVCCFVIFRRFYDNIRPRLVFGSRVLCAR